MPMAPQINLSHFDTDGTTPTATSGAQRGNRYCIISPVPRTTNQSASVGESPALMPRTTTQIASATETARLAAVQSHRKMRPLNVVFSGKVKLVVV